MSTDYEMDIELDLEKFKKSVKRLGLEVGVDEGSTYITDGTNYLHLNTNENKVYGFSKYGLSDPEYMIDLIEDNFGVKILDEYTIAEMMEDEDEKQESRGSS